MPVRPTIRQLFGRRARRSTGRRLGVVGHFLAAWIWAEFWLENAPKAATALVEPSGLTGPTVRMFRTSSVSLDQLEGEEQ